MKYVNNDVDDIVHQSIVARKTQRNIKKVIEVTTPVVKKKSKNNASKKKVLSENEEKISRKKKSIVQKKKKNEKNTKCFEKKIDKSKSLKRKRTIANIMSLTF